MTEERQRLVTENMRLAVHLANRYRSISGEYDEIISAAYYGLVKAANTFNADKNIVFSTYAAKCIVNEILMYARYQKKHSVVRVSLQQSILDEEDIVFEDVVAADFSELEACESKIDFQRKINRLNKRELQIVSIKILNPDKTQSDISNEVGVSQSCVSRAFKSAKRKMMGEVA